MGILKSMNQYRPFRIYDFSAQYLVLQLAFWGCNNNIWDMHEHQTDINIVLHPECMNSWYQAILLSWEVLARSFLSECQNLVLYNCWSSDNECSIEYPCLALAEASVLMLSGYSWTNSTSYVSRGWLLHLDLLTWLGTCLLLYHNSICAHQRIKMVTNWRVVCLQCWCKSGMPTVLPQELLCDCEKLPWLAQSFLQS